ncbi:TetR/AcrR family transcriptional regulator [Streptomyces muensis]|uniref:TetR/AcrR family transcriptional regulator n=1 Tax=Streptomyces muensis TaxID=1077944 RepID=A0A9X1Q0M5_STRM4|nr:TetR/AcrR family transcriptional regulator [Streptomyces muensis]MCF1595203.1 TetR/AcrR family transcriptional regulator [Streptomyces muensis]
MGSAAHGQRVPNRLGEGERLRQDILDTATRILEESGREDALSLRGIAREVGIAAPSIYLHFKNKTDLIWTVLDTAYSALASLMSEAERQAAGTGADAWERLSAAADAYRRYAVDNPRRYRLMFSLEQQASVQRHATEHHPLTRVLHAWTEAVERYLTDACPQRREEAQTMATLLWTGMHGQFALWHTLPHPFAEDDAILVELQQALMRRLLLPSE